MSAFFQAQCPWWLAGLLIGTFPVVLQWGANLRWGSTGPYTALETWVREPANGPEWRVFLLVGAILGALIYTVAFGGGLHPSFANGAFDLRYGSSLASKGPILLGGGALVGYGARTAGGCTAGNGISACGRGSPAGFVATATFMGVAIAAAHVLAWATGGAGGLR